MKMRYTFLVMTIFTFSGFVNNIYSQESSEKPSLDRSDVENQFNYVLRNASDYEDSKVVKSWWLWRLKSHVLDTITSLKDSINEAYTVIDIKNIKIDSLNTDLMAVNKKLKTAIGERDSLKFLGINMSKIAYNTILWSIISILVALVLIFVFLFKRSNSVTTTTKTSLEELKEEFDVFRKRALEREQQIARELYDEIIKYKKKLGEL